MKLIKLQNTKLTHINLLRSYTLTMEDQKKKSRKQSHLLSLIKKNKISKDKSIQGSKRSVFKNKQTNKNRKYKILMKEIKMTQTDGKIYHGFGLEEYCENDSTLQNNLQI